MLHNISVNKAGGFGTPERELLSMSEEERTIERIAYILSRLSPEDRDFALRLAEQACPRAAADTGHEPSDQTDVQSR